jgi:hypothetical protein
VAHKTAEARTEYQKSYRTKNRDRILRRTAQYRAENRAEIRQKERMHRALAYLGHYDEQTHPRCQLELCPLKDFEKKS